MKTTPLDIIILDLIVSSWYAINREAVPSKTV